MAATLSAASEAGPGAAAPPFPSARRVSHARTPDSRDEPADRVSKSPQRVAPLGTASEDRGAVAYRAGGECAAGGAAGGAVLAAAPLAGFDRLEQIVAELTTLPGEVVGEPLVSPEPERRCGPTTRLPWSERISRPG
jgi:hypothetical protein